MASWDFCSSSSILNHININNQIFIFFQPEGPVEVERARVVAKDALLAVDQIAGDGRSVGHDDPGVHPGSHGVSNTASIADHDRWGGVAVVGTRVAADLRRAAQCRADASECIAGVDVGRVVERAAGEATTIAGFATAGVSREHAAEHAAIAS